MSELKEYFESLDFDFRELQVSLAKTKKARQGTVDETFKVDEFINLCRWFLGDALKAIEGLSADYFQDHSKRVRLQTKLAGVVAVINIPFAALQSKRSEVWEVLKKEVPEICTILGY